MSPLPASAARCSSSAPGVFSASNSARSSAGKGALAYWTTTGVPAGEVDQDAVHAVQDVPDMRPM